MSHLPDWLQDAVFYQIYPQSFCDTNGDGIGDIPGIIRKLDYIQSLGVNALWLNPCFLSPFQDAGYDVADYLKVAPRYGTNADLVRLFKAAHRRGMKVCLDFVAGHTSIEHSWFKESCKPERNKYTDRYIWTPSVWHMGDGKMHFINGYSNRDGNYAINFFYSQPALNFGFAHPDPKHPWQQPINAPGPRATRRELKNILDFWLSKGADGFRCDMAPSLVKHDRNFKENGKLWREIRKWMDAKYPEAILISEWSHPEKAIDAGFHLDFMIQFGVEGYGALFLWGDSFFKQDGRGDITRFLKPFMEQLSLTRNKGYVSVPSANHDIARPRSKDRNLKDMKVLFTFLLTLPGIPLIYYGDEIGMRFIDGLPSKEGGFYRTGSRTPMQWDNTRNAGFSAAPGNKLYLPIDPRKKRPNVKAQDADPKSLLNYVRRLLALRHSSQALQTNGEIVPLYAKKKKCPVVFMRRKGKDKFLVAANPSAEPVRVRVPAQGKREPVPEIVHGTEIARKGDKLELAMQGVSYGVFRL
jgi:maltose alpha-D-glucosyltransferase/alpha-amylase